MFGYFKKKPSPPKVPLSGLEAIAVDLRLGRQSWGFEDNLPGKLELVKHIAKSMDSDIEVPRQMLSELVADDDVDVALLTDYELLSSYGRGVAMLWFCLGALTSFYGRGAKEVLGNVVEGDGTEFRAIIFCCKAYEQFGGDPVVASSVTMALQTIRSKIDNFTPEPTGNELSDAAQSDIDRIGRHIDRLYYAHYRPKAMPGFTTRDPEEKAFLPLDDAISRALKAVG